MAPRADFDIATRAQVVTLKALNFTNQQITQQTGIQSRAINYIYDREIQRGFDPNATLLIIYDTHVQTISHSGRPSKQTEEVKEKVLNKIWQDRYGREKSCAYIAAEIRGMSLMTV